MSRASVASSAEPVEMTGLEKALENVMTKLCPSTNEHIHTLLGVAYRAKKECFEIVGDVHGEEQHFSVRFHITRDYYTTMHVYGRATAYAFKVSKYTIRMRSDGVQQEFEVPFHQRAPQWGMAGKDAPRKSVW